MMNFHYIDEMKIIYCIDLSPEDFLIELIIIELGNKINGNIPQN